MKTNFIPTSSLRRAFFGLSLLVLAASAAISKIEKCEVQPNPLGWDVHVWLSTCTFDLLVGNCIGYCIIEKVTYGSFCSLGGNVGLIGKDRSISVPIYNTVTPCISGESFGSCGCQLPNASSTWVIVGWKLVPSCQTALCPSGVGV